MDAASNHNQLKHLLHPKPAYSVSRRLAITKKPAQRVRCAGWTDELVIQ